MLQFQQDILKNLLKRNLCTTTILIYSLCSCDKRSFYTFSIFTYLIQLPLSPSVQQIIKELHFSSSYFFHFRHLSFSGIIKKVIYSQNMSNWLFYAGYYLEVPFSLLYVQKRNYLLCITILSSPFSSRTTFESSSNISAPIFLVSRSLSDIKQCSKHNIQTISS